MSRIVLDGIAHSYRSNPQGAADWALKEVNHVWEDGQAYALLGPSGCGKTTLLNLISGLLTPSRGRILFGDSDVTDMPPEARNIAQVFQFPVIYDTMSVFDNLAFPLRNRRVPEAEVRTRVEEMLRIIDLQDKAKRKAANLSADEKQKISLGRGLVRSDVNAILFDEPLTVIDPHMKWVLRSQLKHLHKRFGFTMIYVTHDQTEALTFADKVVVMYEGEVVQFGTPEELFEKPRHTFVGYFIGSPGMNVLPASVDGREAILGGNRISLSGSYERAVTAEIGVRPEFVRVARAGEGLPVQIRRVEDLGRFRVVRASLEGHEVNAVVGEDQELPAEASLVFDPARVNVYVDSHLVEPRA
ncbi:ABC transporter ATP-binding protein [Lutibaculum baratangense]|uniref:Glycerol-3-phosphate ABC transporter, ATP-binding protein UgpC n=1 Tax=Lutibaculum baratangense AMV1 TaxID=631454 RepID=V4RB15_9HYPH|nr:ABC transporter ATP-binding protein [Lutibaculum baratangense]ESR23366.1 Glycerol-3-phosphate ABC transporter, ATP-binding protein UgpC [Lutibaculum baratangense AMV1]